MRLRRDTGPQSLESLARELSQSIPIEGSFHIARIGSWWIGRTSSDPYPIRFVGKVLFSSRSICVRITTFLPEYGESYAIITNGSQTFSTWQPSHRIRDILPVLITGLEAGGWAALANRHPGKTCYFWRT